VTKPRSASDGDNKPITGESTKETVKTIACGSAGLIRWTCGDYTRVLFTLRTRLRVHWASGVPHALQGGSIMYNSGKTRRENAESYLDVIARSKATKQSTLSLRGEMDCFAEPVIGRRVAPTRWLAMTVSGPLNGVDGPAHRHRKLNRSQA
jgi:hypothetical protein